MLEEFARDRINNILFSLEHVIKMGEEKMSGKRRVCVIYMFNRIKSLSEGVVEKKSLAFILLKAYFLKTEEWRKPAVKCEQTPFSGLPLCLLIVQFLGL